MTGLLGGPRRDTSILVALAGGHVVVAAGVVVLARQLVRYRLAEPAGPPGSFHDHGVAASLLAAGLVALVVGQLLSVRRLHVHRRAVATGRLGAEALARGARRLAWPVALAFYPLFLGPMDLLIDPPPPELLALVAALVLGSLLLDHTHAGWMHGHAAATPTDQHAPFTGSGRRIRSGQGGSVAVAVLLTVIAAAALVAQCLGASRGGLDPTDVLQAVATFSVVLLGLFLLRPARLVHAAVHDDDTVDTTTLDTAAALFRRSGAVAAVASALTVAAVLARPDLAMVATAVPLVLLVGSDALQLGSLTSITLNDGVALGHRRNRRVPGGDRP